MLIVTLCSNLVVLSGVVLVFYLPDDGPGPKIRRNRIEIVQSRDCGCEGEGVLNFGIMMNWLQWSPHALKTIIIKINKYK